MDTAGVARRVQRIFGDTASVQITTADIIDWINEGQLRIVRETECLLKDVSFNLVSGTVTYPLPPDFVRAKRIAYKGYKLVETLREDIEKLNQDATTPDTGDPSFYFIEGANFYLFPEPSGSGTAFITMRYVYAPAELTTTSDPLALPLIHHEALTRFCLMRANELNENEPAVKRLADDVFAQIGKSQFDANNQSDSYPVVRDYDYETGYY